MLSMTAAFYAVMTLAVLPRLVPFESCKSTVTTASLCKSVKLRVTEDVSPAEIILGVDTKW